MNRGVTAIDGFEARAHAGSMKHTESSMNTSANPLAQQRYIALTTFTRDGTRKCTPVWPVDAGDGRLGFVTSSRTWKAKRINNDSRVEVQPSDAKGRPLENSSPAVGSAVLVIGDAFESMHRSVKAKYGYQLRIINMLHALPGRRTGYPNDCAVLISLDP